MLLDATDTDKGSVDEVDLHASRANGASAETLVTLTKRLSI